MTETRPVESHEAWAKGSEVYSDPNRYIPNSSSGAETRTQGTGVTPGSHLGHREQLWLCSTDFLTSRFGRESIIHKSVSVRHALLLAFLSSSGDHTSLIGAVTLTLW